jgi:hypothetical protein
VLYGVGQPSMGYRMGGWDLASTDDVSVMVGVRAPAHECRCFGVSHVVSVDASASLTVL